MNTVLTDSDKAHAQSHLERARPFIGKICRAPFVAHASLQRPSNQPNAKLVHWIRHGQGFHNLMADFHREHGIEGSPYKHPALHDPPLTALGREQAAALCTHAKMLAPTLVVVSPLARATKTALIAFDHLVGAVPFVADGAAADGAAADGAAGGRRGAGHRSPGHHRHRHKRSGRSDEEHAEFLEALAVQGPDD